MSSEMLEYYSKMFCNFHWQNRKSAWFPGNIETAIHLISNEIIFKKLFMKKNSYKNVSDNIFIFIFYTVAQ